MSVTRVLVVDDSALVRQLLRDLLSADPDIEVVGTAPDPIVAWQCIQRLHPDVLTLDVEMPRMNGLQFLGKLMRAHPLPVVMCSSFTQSGCETTLRALELGAVDFVCKPMIDVQRGVEMLSAELCGKVKAAARSRPRARESARTVSRASAHDHQPVLAAKMKWPPVVVAIGASTGGTEALVEILEALPADAPGVVVVQHMPEHFTRHFAERLDRVCTVTVREAAHGDRILPGSVLVAPGGVAHLEVARSPRGPYVTLVAGPPVHHNRPSVDVLFDSCARSLGPHAVGVILTGMGSDGAAGLLAMRNAGARTIAQNEATCVVFGMPREAIARGGVEVVVPLSGIAAELKGSPRRPFSGQDRSSRTGEPS